MILLVPISAINSLYDKVMGHIAVFKGYGFCIGTKNEMKGQKGCGENDENDGEDFYCLQSKIPPLIRP